MTDRVDHPVNHHEKSPPIQKGPEGRKSLRHNARRRRDSNPQAVARAAFRVRCLTS
jgi:hypothetical protein